MLQAGHLADSSIKCYSQRLLNPFRGAVNIIRYKSAEAVTSDGVHWDIYVSNDSLLDGLEGKRAVQISDIRYGRWSSHEGLIRGPVYPGDEFYVLEAMGAVVYQHLQKVHDRIPFTFRDNIELWLLDRAFMPLALLNSVVDAGEIDDYQLLDWRAGQLCKESFRPACIENDNAGSLEYAADQLIDCINSCAQIPPGAQWFERHRDGSATGLHGHNIDTSLRGRVLDAAEFPLYFVSTDHHDDYHARLVEEFLQWQAPWLLLLDTLSEEERRYFEGSARKQAMVVDQQYLLYPQVLDESFIRAARVEAELRKTQIQPVDQDEVMSTFYIELHPSPTE